MTKNEKSKAVATLTDFMGSYAKERTVYSETLEKLLGVSGRSLRSLISENRFFDDGVIIRVDGKGYMFTTKKSEVTRCAWSLINQALSTVKTARKMFAFVKDVDAESQLDLFIKSFGDAANSAEITIDHKEKHELATRID